jgi:hypothetical protein
MKFINTPNRFLPLIFSVLIFSICLSCSQDDNANLNSNPDVPNEPEEPADEVPEFAGELDVVMTYGGSNQDEAKAVVETPDGNFVIVGTTRSTDGDIVDKEAPNFDVWLFKVNPQGTILWSKTYGGSNDEFGEDVIVTNDGGLAVIGYNSSTDGDTSSNAGFFDHWLLKLDASGNLEWQQSYGYEGQDQAFSLIQTDDGGFFFGGYFDVSASNGNGNDGFTTTSQQESSSNFENNAALHGVGEFWGTKVDATGTLQFRRYFGGSNNDRCYGVIDTPDGGYLMAGSSESTDFDISNSKGSYDFWVVKVNTDKELEWQRSYGGSEIDMGFGFTETLDGNYLITGDTRSSDQDVSNLKGNADFWAVKINGSGDIIWENTYGGTQFDAARTIVQMSDGRLAIAGSSRSNDIDVLTNKGQNDCWIAVVSSSGNIDQTFSIGGSELDFLYDIYQTQNNELIAVGSSSSNDQDIAPNKGSSDVVFIKIK